MERRHDLERHECTRTFLFIYLSPLCAFHKASDCRESITQLLSARLSMQRHGDEILRSDQGPRTRVQQIPNKLRHIFMLLHSLLTNLNQEFSLLSLSFELLPPRSVQISI